MKVLICGKCGHIEFGEAPQHCLVCYSVADQFTDNAAAIKRPEDPGELTEGDRKHIPVLTVENGAVTATVGEIEHVMQEAHFIRYLDYYLDHKFVSRVWLSPETCRPMATIQLAAESGTVQVIENCNVHGNWLAETTL